MSRNYINNKTLYESMKIHYENVQSGNRVQVNNYIGQAILLICNNLAKKPNFSGYTYKSDMISDGIVDCVAAVDNFNPNKTNNPFAYFTQIAWNAYIRRIHKEKKQNYIKHKNLVNMYTLDEIWQESTNQFKTYESSDELIKNFENNLTKIKKPAKVIGLGKFIEEK